MKKLLLIALIFAGCEIRYTQSEMKQMDVGDTVFCQAYFDPMIALITANDTTKKIICYKRAWNYADLKYGRDECQTYDDFRIIVLE